MKTLRILLLMTLTTLFAGCADDDENDFSAEFLQQTIWEGTYVVTDNENKTISSSDILIQFLTTSDAQYSEKVEGTDYMDTEKFTYSVEGKIMTTKGAPISKELTLIEFSENKMVFVAYASYKVTITLTRKY